MYFHIVYNYNIYARSTQKTVSAPLHHLFDGFNVTILQFVYIRKFAVRFCIVYTIRTLRKCLYICLNLAQNRYKTL